MLNCLVFLFSPKTPSSTKTPRSAKTPRRPTGNKDPVEVRKGDFSSKGRIRSGYLFVYATA